MKESRKPASIAIAVLAFFVFTVGFASSSSRAASINAPRLPAATPAPTPTPMGANVSPLSPSSKTLFEDSEALTAYFTFDNHTGTFSDIWPHDANLGDVWNVNASEHSYTSSELGSFPWYFNQLAASDAGRFFDPAKDTDPHWQSVAYAFFQPDGNVEVEIFNQGTRQASYLTLAGVSGYTGSKSVDLKVEDVDLYQDETGHVHDEIIVARTGGDGTWVYVDVLKVDPHNGQLSIAASDRWQWNAPPTYVTEFVSLTTGDFNGDRFPDFAVNVAGSQTEQPSLFVAYDLAHSDENLVSMPLHLQQHWGVYIYTRGANMDTCSGDFDGDSKDEILLVHASHNIAYAIFQSDQNWHWSVVANHYLSSSSAGAHGADNATLAAAAGTFVYDPANGYDLNKKQVAVCWRYIQAWLVCDIYDPSNFSQQMPLLSENAHNANDSGSYAIGNLAIAAGNFIGHQGNPSSPAQQLLVYAMWGNGNFSNSWHVSFVYQMNSNMVLNYVVANTSSSSQGWPQTAIVAAAYDRDGDTWALGAASLFTFNDVISLDNVTEEPPKHVDYLPVDPGNPEGEWEMVNVSGVSDFNVSYTDSQDNSTTNKNTNTSDWSIGGAATLDVGLTEKSGPVKVSADASAKMSYEYDSKKASYDSSYHSRTQSFSVTTSNDDSVIGTMKAFHVWRYTILNYYTGDANNPIGVWDLVLPFDTVKFAFGGTDVSDWYQPLHENHNILSYPQYNITVWPPAGEVGCFSWYDTQGHPTDICEPLNSIEAITWGGDAYHESVDWTSTSGSGSSKEYSHTLSESLDVKLSTEVKMEYLVGSDKLTASMDVDFNNSNSWGGSTEEESEASNSTGIEVNIPAGGEQAIPYGIETAVYVSQNGGAFKVAQAANVLESTTGADAWMAYYNRKPDPALNLPNKFFWHPTDATHGEEWWALNSDDNRKQMRGFLVRSSTYDQAAGEYPLLATAPTDGDTVRLCARVYNYSLSKPTGLFNVKFYYYLWDNDAAELVGDPVSQPAMDSSVSLDGVQTPGGTSMKEVCVPWSTTGLSAACSASRGYRFMVNLDEQNQVDEIHEFEDANGNEVPGGNNSGYWPWDGVWIVNAKSALGLEGDPKLSTPDIAMQEVSLKIQTPNGLVSDAQGYEFVKGQQQRTRADILSDTDSGGFRHVLFYEGNPDEGAVAFADSIAFGVKEGGPTVWANWTPKTVGQVTLYARVLERPDDPQLGNAQDSITLTVVEATAIPTATPTATATPTQDRGGGEDGGCSLANETDRRASTMGVALLGLVFGVFLCLRRRAR
jgi:hypothetical protein